MDEVGIFPFEAADVAMQAIKDGVARVKMTREEAYTKAEADIKYARDMTSLLSEKGFIKDPPQQMIQDALNWAIKEVTK